MAGRGGDGGSFVWSIIWFLILIFVAFWVAGFCAGWHILIQPFSVCIQGCQSIQELLLKGFHLPRVCAENMIAGKAGFN